MTLIHLHLMMNHVPLMASIFGALVLLVGLLWRKDDVIRVALLLFVVGGLSAGITYMTGEPAEEAIEAMPGVSDVALEAHESAALAAVLGAAALGVAGLGGLLIYRKRAPHRGMATGLLLLALAASGWTGYTASLGGQIRHAELRSAGGPPAAPGADHEAGEQD